MYGILHQQGLFSLSFSHRAPTMLTCTASLLSKLFVLLVLLIPVSSSLTHSLAFHNLAFVCH